tara:strand:- start:367 stop:945 length:579 start_codon:yes stop_codon:yes gene_type:complete
MTWLKSIFAKKAPIDPAELPPPNMSDKYDEFRKILGAVGKEMPTRYSGAYPHICNFNEESGPGNKKTIKSFKNSVHLMYYEREIGTSTSLLTMHIDRTNECFRFQKLHEIDNAEEAIKMFTEAVESYADRLFTRILKEKLCASDVINLALDQEGALCIPQSDKDVELVQGAKGAKEVSEGKKQTSLSRGPIQ